MHFYQVDENGVLLSSRKRKLDKPDKNAYYSSYLEITILCPPVYDCILIGASMCSR
jgi:hypothetical protein